MSRNPVKKGDVLEIYTDGASRDNPGPAAYAFIFVKDGKVIYRENEYIGKATNNTAEYNAIISALQKAEEYTSWDIALYSDSQLAINQINGVWRIHADHLSELCNKVLNLLKKFENVKFKYVSRNNKMIQKCDNLCNKVLNEKGSRFSI
jgi:ribonuclease HI